MEVKPLNLIGVQEVRRLLYGDIEAKEGVQQIRISQMDVANAMRRALVEGIKGWNLDDYEGAKLFVTFETVADLAVDDQRAILKKILGSITEFNAVFGLNETATVITGAATPPTVPEAPPLDSEAFPEGSPPTSPAILTA